MQLTDGSITLRRFKESDMDTMAEMANNRSISDNMRDAFPNPYTPIHARAFIEKFMHDQPNTVFAIECEGRHVGNAGLHPGEDVYRKSAEVGYFIGEPYWGHGYATRAVKLITSYGFNHLSLERIHAGVFEFNPASANVLRKAGFESEGVARKAVYKHGQLWDELRFALLP